jgi:hypothetical protein
MRKKEGNTISNEMRKNERENMSGREYERERSRVAQSFSSSKYQRKDS